MNSPSASAPILLLSALTIVEPGVARAVEADGVPTVLVLRSADTGASTESYALLNGDMIAVPPDALRALGIRLSSGEPRDLMPLSDVPGLGVTLDRRRGEATLSCAMKCYVTQVIGDPAQAPSSVLIHPGAFMNVDVTYGAIQRARNAAGAFEVGVFGARGQGEASWTVGARDGAEVVRLETRWTIDDVGRRVRYRFGDSLSRAGATSAPFRFGGLQIARDFALDPRFVTFPTPELAGVATTPSVVDLYVDGALRLRERVNAGPFSIPETPVVSGAGQAQIVVTDALGRQQVTSAPFYASRSLLKPGLSDFSFALGALRERFAAESADYGDVFLSGAYRRGWTSALTAELYGETTRRQSNIGAGFSWLADQAGQADVAVALSSDDGEGGALVRLGFTRISQRLSIGAEIDQASAGFARIGSRDAAPRTRGAFSAGVSDARFGYASVSATMADYRDKDDIATLALDYVPGRAGRAALGFTVLYVAADTETLSLAVRFAAPLGAYGSAAATGEARDGRWTTGASAHAPPPADGGVGWRVSARSGDVERRDAGVRLETLRGVFDLEASRVGRTDGVRAQAAFGLAWIDDGLFVSRPIRESFALVDARAPGVHVSRDNRRVGVTDRDGRALVTGLRPYEDNRLGIEIDDLPTGMPVVADAIIVTPAARAGAVVRFPLHAGAAGEVRVVDQDGAPLPAGAMLVRATDGARFPVGEDGRVYVEGVREGVVLHRAGQAACAVYVATQAVAANARVECRRSDG